MDGTLEEVEEVERPRARVLDLNTMRFHAIRNLHSHTIREDWQRFDMPDAELREWLAQVEDDEAFIAEQRRLHNASQE